MSDWNFEDFKGSQRQTRNVQPCSCDRCNIRVENGSAYAGHLGYCEMAAELETDARAPLDGDTARTSIEIEVSGGIEPSIIVEKGCSTRLKIEIQGTCESAAWGKAFRAVGAALPQQDQCLQSGHIYIIRAGDTNRYKIGFTSKAPSERMRQLQTANALPLSLIAYWQAPSSVETKVHALFQTSRLEGEWFELSADQVLAKLPDITKLLS